MKKNPYGQGMGLGCLYVKYCVKVHHLWKLLISRIYLEKSLDVMHGNNIKNKAFIP